MIAELQIDTTEATYNASSSTDQALHSATPGDLTDNSTVRELWSPSTTQSSVSGLSATANISYGIGELANTTADPISSSTVFLGDNNQAHYTSSANDTETTSGK